MSKLKTVLTLFGTFFKIGAFTFGGGYAMIPVIQKEVAEDRNWITSEDILDVIAIAESTPGPLAINSATFVGYKIAGFFGSFAATFGVVLPSFIIISLIALVLDQFASNQVVQFAFNGIRAGVLALMLKAIYNMYKSCKKYPFAYCVMAAAFIAVAFTPINVLFVIIGCAIAGLVYSMIVTKGAKA